MKNKTLRLVSLFLVIAITTALCSCSLIQNRDNESKAKAEAKAEETFDYTAAPNGVVKLGDVYYLANCGGIYTATNLNDTPELLTSEYNPKSFVTDGRIMFFGAVRNHSDDYFGDAVLCSLDISANTVKELYTLNECDHMDVVAVVGSDVYFEAGSAYWSHLYKYNLDENKAETLYEYTRISTYYSGKIFFDETHTDVSVHPIRYYNTENGKVKVVSQSGILHNEDGIAIVNAMYNEDIENDTRYFAYSTIVYYDGNEVKESPPVPETISGVDITDVTYVCAQGNYAILSNYADKKYFTFDLVTGETAPINLPEKTFIVRRDYESDAIYFESDRAYEDTEFEMYRFVDDILTKCGTIRMNSSLRDAHTYLVFGNTIIILSDDGINTVEFDKPKDSGGSAECPYDYEQKLTVTAASGSSRADAVLYEWKNGSWKKIKTYNATVGSKGIGTPKEGVNITPEGIFRLGVVLSENNINTSLDTYKATSSTSVVDDPDSAYYNRIMETGSIPSGTHYDNIGEGLTDGTTYATIYIEHNGNGFSSKDVVPDKGSAIGLRGQNGSLSATYGDVDISAADMKDLLSRLRAAKNPMIEIKTK